MSNPPKNWSGKIINHAKPPAELAEFTNEASNRPNPREVNATKNGIRNNRKPLVFGLNEAPNNKVRSSITRICIAATIN